MQNSAEIRWFWSSPVDGIDSWFHSGPFRPGGGEPRQDDYLVDPRQVELGIKKRGKKKDGPGIEVKGLVGRLSSNFELGTLVGQGELWTKWSTAALTLDGMTTVPTHKVRLLRKFAVTVEAVREIQLDEKENPSDPGDPLPKEGCNLEFTKVSLDDTGPEWWTIGFEAFGSFDSVEKVLRRTCEHLAAGPLPSFVAGAELSYPAWLALQSSSHSVGMMSH